MSEIFEIPLHLITPGDNDRTDFDPAKIRALADSIRANGLAQPITVRPNGTGFEIVAGERRFRAYLNHLYPVDGVRTIPAMIRDLTDEQAAAVMLVENTSRADLNPLEQGEAFAKRAGMGWSIERIAEVSGFSTDTVRRRMDLLKLVPEARLLVARGQLRLGYAEAMVSLDTNRQRIVLRILAKSDSVPVSQVRQICGELQAEQEQDSLFSLADFWTKQVETAKPLPRSGRHAVTAAPIRTDLPPVTLQAKDTTALVIERYICELVKAGKRDEAGAIGTLYNGLVKGNLLTVSPSSPLYELVENI